MHTAVILLLIGLFFDCLFVFPSVFIGFSSTTALSSLTAFPRHFPPFLRSLPWTWQQHPLSDVWLQSLTEPALWGSESVRGWIRKEGAAGTSAPPYIVIVWPSKSLLLHLVATREVHSKFDHLASQTDLHRIYRSGSRFTLSHGFGTSLHQGHCS